MKTSKLALGGLFAAIICLLTIFVRIPLPQFAGGAYVNAGDAGVYLAAAIMGGWPAIIAAAVGSALADLIVGAPLYVGATFLIKGVMAFIASAILAKNPHHVLRQALAFIVAGAAMAAGYFLYELPVFGAAYAISSLPFNVIQIAGGVILGIAATQAAQKMKLNILV